MAVEEEDENKSNDEDVENKPKKKKPWLIIGVIAFLFLTLALGSTVGALYYMGIFSPEDQKLSSTAVDKKGEAIKKEDSDEDEEDAEEDESEEDEIKKIAIYIPIESTFVVNFVGESKVRFLQVTVEIMTRDESVVESINTHMPVIRNNLTFLFSSHSYEDVSTVAGKEQLRNLALSEVQKIMEEETGNPAAEALYFTSFVTQ